MTVAFELSIAIPTLNEERNIGRLLDSISTHLPSDISAEVIVGDHGSVDKTVTIASEKGARVLLIEGGTIGYLRNKIVDQCSGQIIVFLDADTSVTDEWSTGLRAIVEDIKIFPNQVTGSFCITPNSTQKLHKYWFSMLGRRNAGYLGTAHMIIQRDLFRRLGGFDTRLVSGEDFDLCARAVSIGAEMRPRPTLRVIHHDYPTTLKAFVRREMWHGAGDFHSFKNFRSSKVGIVTVLFMLLNVTALLSLLRSPYEFAIALMCIFLLLLLCSYSRFKGLGFFSRICNVGIFYLYFLGRSGSFLQAARTRFNPSTKP